MNNVFGYEVCPHCKRNVKPEVRCKSKGIDRCLICNELDVSHIRDINMDNLYTAFRLNYFGERLPSIEDVSVAWNNKFKTTAGRCYSRKKLIQLSSYVHETYPEKIENTFVHEMIHLIHANHGDGFKSECERINSINNLELKTKYSLKVLEERYNRKLEHRKNGINYRWRYTCVHCNDVTMAKRRWSNFDIRPKDVSCGCQRNAPNRFETVCFKEEKL